MQIVNFFLNNLPIIQYAVDTCVEAGVEEIIFVYKTNSYVFSSAID